MVYTEADRQFFELVNRRRSEQKMKLTYSKQAYQWPGGVGVLVMDGDYVITRDDGRMFRDECEPRHYVLMAHSHTRELEFVAVRELLDYPSEPIPQP